MTAQTKQKFVHELFCKIAHRYDLLNSLLSFNQDKYWRRVAICQTEIVEGQKVLDVGCGTGRLTSELAQRVGPRGEVVGLDFCRNMLDVAVNHIANSPFGSVVTLLEGDAMALPFEDNSFDCVATAFALRNVPDLRTVLAEMRRVVKPGGRVVSLELAKPSRLGFKQAYYLYFEKILPFLGQLGVGIDGPYHWLPKSLRLFPHQEELCALFSDIGFNDATYYELTGGIVAIHVGVK